MNDITKANELLDNIKKEIDEVEHLLTEEQPSELSENIPESLIAETSSPVPLSIEEEINTDIDIPLLNEEPPVGTKPAIPSPADTNVYEEPIAESSVFTPSVEDTPVAQAVFTEVPKTDTTELSLEEEMNAPEKVLPTPLVSETQKAIDDLLHTDATLPSEIQTTGAGTAKILDTEEVTAAIPPVPPTTTPNDNT